MRGESLGTPWGWGSSSASPKPLWTYQEGGKELGWVSRRPWSGLKAFRGRRETIEGNNERGKPVVRSFAQKSEGRLHPLSLGTVLG